MARKLVKRAAREDSSDLSSAPPDFDDQINTSKEEVPSPTKGTKRKRNSGTAATATNGHSTSAKTAEAAGEISPPPKRPQRGKKAPVYATESEENEYEDGSASKPGPVAKSPAKRAPRKKIVAEVKEEDEAVAEPAAKLKSGKAATAKAKVTKAKEVKEEKEEKVVKKRKTKEEKEAEAMPLAARSAIGNKMVIGAHVSAAGGVQNAVSNALHIGANAFALFLKSQRTWTNPDLKPEIAESFHDHCKKHEYNQEKHVVPHGSYLVNLAATDAARTKQAYDSFLDDLKRCETLGITLYNFHPGNALANDRKEAIRHLASNLNRAHKETSTVVTLLENMAAGGNVLGSTFEDLGEIIEQVEDKSRVGVCLDTCHAFAGGYDLRNKETLDATLADFEKTVGLKYLRALHLNDSKAPFQSHRDLHANIGTGFVGLHGFHAIMNEQRFWGLPGVLETPIEVRDEDGVPVKNEKGKETEDKGIWAREIKLLESLVGMDVESEEFKKLDEKLQRQGLPERERIIAQVEKKNEKDAKTAAKAKAKNGAAAKGVTAKGAGAKGAGAKGAGAKGKGKGKKVEVVESESKGEAELSELEELSSEGEKS